MKPHAAPATSPSRPISVMQCLAPGVVVLQCRGRLDLVTSQDFGWALGAALANAQRALILDLAAVTFMDSAGIYRVLQAIRQLAPDARMVICGVPRRLNFLLEIAGIRPPAPHVTGEAAAPAQIGAAFAGKVAIYPDVPAAVHGVFHRL